MDAAVADPSDDDDVRYNHVGIVELLRVRI